MRLAVVDGQGGGIGKAIVEKLINAELPDVEIIALGTNAVATGQMLKAGADIGATGENAIVYNMNNVDVIVGVIAIVASNSMLGELTPAMASAISSSSAYKVLIPINRCGIHVVGVVDSNLGAYVDESVKIIRNYITGVNDNDKQKGRQ